LNFVALSLTGEYDELGRVCEASIDFSSFTVDGLVSLSPPSQPPLAQRAQ